MTLAANLLNAVGGQPVLDAPHLMPGYPSSLPHGDRSFEVSLVPFGAEALELSLRIERAGLHTLSWLGALLLRCGLLGSKQRGRLIPLMGSCRQRTGPQWHPTIIFESSSNQHVVVLRALPVLGNLLRIDRSSVATSRWGGWTSCW